MKLHRYLLLRERPQTLPEPLCKPSAESQTVEISAEGRYLRLLLCNGEHVGVEAFVNVDDLLLTMDVDLPGIPWISVPLGYLVRWLRAKPLCFLTEESEWHVQQMMIPDQPIAERLLQQPARPCQLLFQQWPETPRKITLPDSPPLSAQIPFRVNYVLGGSQLPLSALTEVAAGDLLLIARSDPRLVTGGRALFYFSYDHHQEIIVEEPVDYAQEEYRREEEILFTWSELPVNIEFVLDSRTMSLRELDNLRPGTSLPVTAGAEQKVKIYLNSKLFARGELVALEDGSLAVEVSQLSQQAGSDTTDHNHAEQ